MSQDIADMPGIEAAMERFNAMVPDATNGSNATSATAKTDVTAAPPSSDRRETPKADAQPTAKSDAQTSVTSPTDTRAATDTAADVTNQQQRDAQGRFAAPEAKPDAAKPNDKPAETENGNDGKSRYAKAQERLEKTWESVNKRKSELDTQAQQIEQQRLTLEREKAQFEAIRRQAEEPHTPEKALHASQLRRQSADALRMQAKRAEDAGRFEEAQRLNKQADRAESLADEMAEYAEHLRKNPPLSMQQRQQQFEQARKEWTIEACKAFPELGTNGSRLQQVVAQHLKALQKADPQLLVHPSLIYHVTRLSDAQIKLADVQAVAARVPVLEKEAESLRARIKELEAATTPAGNGGVNKLGTEPKDDYASLRQSAAELGPVFR